MLVCLTPLDTTNQRKLYLTLELETDYKEKENTKGYEETS